MNHRTSSRLIALSLAGALAAPWSLDLWGLSGQVWADDIAPAATPSSAEKSGAVGTGEASKEDAGRKEVLPADGEEAVTVEIVVAPKADESEEKTPEELAREQAKKDLEAMQLELQRLTTEYQLMQQRQKNALAQSELEKQELAAAAALEQARLDKELSAMKAELSRLQVSLQLEKARRQEAQEATEALLDQRELDARLRASELEAQVERLKLAAQQLQAENLVRQEELKRAQMEAQQAKQAYEIEMADLRGKLEMRTTMDTFNSKVVEPVTYRADPLDGRTLWVSDRRISLNGPITTGTADYVCDRIDFLNNRSKTDPIFVVIDSSPGGSVMEGYRIVKAIETSQAPVHVVVKSFAASMAAVITTLAPHSYALPNAIILHHQMSSGMRGNLTQQREHLENAMEWARRLAEPVARKMGLTYDEFVAEMYRHNSDGDWQEFADRAQELKWVDHIVDEIRETGLRDKPTDRYPTLPFWMESMQYDEKGNPYVKLPPLMPFDHYFLYDPTDFWR